MKLILTESEALEYLQLRQAEKSRKAEWDRLRELSEKVMLAVSVVDEAIVIDPDQAIELLEMANMYME